MSKSTKSGPTKLQWAANVAALRKRLRLSQTLFGKKLDASAMAVSRWERGVQEPTARSYIDLGNLAGGAECWYFWGRAGLRNEDVMRVLPQQPKTRADLPEFEIVRAGIGKKIPRATKLVGIPLLKVVAASHGEKGDDVALLRDAPADGMIAAPIDWCPHPATTSCLRVRGDSMNPLIYDGNIVAVDSSQADRDELDGKIVVAWNKDEGLTVSRFHRYDSTDVLQPENRQYKSVTLDRKNHWKVIARVLWWIGKAP